ncbi:MAG: fumarylacetoacetate hydrolase family protein [Gammaproteobacteria bacterium]|nr:fumarylacetoacetate hydrolase family protein [Gammaproteobacteria bacterium]
MRLASLKRGRDGSLVVVSSALSRMVSAAHIAETLQQALDNWNEVSLQLRDLSDSLESGATSGEPFDEGQCSSPLPRAYQWADGSAYVNHVELVRKARGAEIPASFWTDPLMYQGGSDSFLDPHGPIVMPTDQGWGIDFEAEVAVITDDVPMGTSIEQALQHVKLIMLVNDVSLRDLIPAELAKGFGFFQSKPSTAFSPVCVTPDELGDAWCDGKLQLALRSTYNGELFGAPDAAIDMTFNFAELIAHAAKSRPLVSGSIIGSGTVSNKLNDGPGKPLSQGGVGYSCIAEIRMIETIKNGAPETGYMTFGDTIKIEMLDEKNNSLFGAIDQRIEKYTD